MEPAFRNDFYGTLCNGASLYKTWRSRVHHSRLPDTACPATKGALYNEQADQQFQLIGIAYLEGIMDVRAPE